MGLGFGGVLFAIALTIGLILQAKFYDHGKYYLLQGTAHVIGGACIIAACTIGADTVKHLITTTVGGAKGEVSGLTYIFFAVTMIISSLYIAFLAVNYRGDQKHVWLAGAAYVSFAVGGGFIVGTLYAFQKAGDGEMGAWVFCLIFSIIALFLGTLFAVMKRLKK